MVKSNTYFIIANDSVCLLGLWCQFSAVCDVGCGCVHLGIWLGGAVSMAPSRGWQDRGWQPAAQQGGWQDMHLDCPCGLCFLQHCSWVPNVDRNCQAPHRLGLESLGLPGKALCLFLPIFVVLKMLLPASHSRWLSLPSWLCRTCTLALSLAWAFCLLDFFSML